MLLAHSLGQRSPVVVNPTRFASKENQKGKENPSVPVCRDFCEESRRGFVPRSCNIQLQAAVMCAGKKRWESQLSAEQSGGEEE